MVARRKFSDDRRERIGNDSVRTAALHLVGMVHRKLPPARLGDLQQLGDQSRLADARFAGDEDPRAAADRSAAKQSVYLIMFELPPDEPEFEATELGAA